MNLAPSYLCSNRFRHPEVSNKKERTYVVDDSRDFAHIVASGIHWPRRRWTDSPTARDRADYIHHQHCVGSQNGLTARVIRQEWGRRATKVSLA